MSCNDLLPLSDVQGKLRGRFLSQGVPPWTVSFLNSWNEGSPRHSILGHTAKGVLLKIIRAPVLSRCLVSFWFPSLS